MQAARILTEGGTAGVQTQVSSKGFASLNLERAAALGLQLGEEVVAAFDDIIPASRSVAGRAAT